jgi:hypothetical protein
MGIGSRIDYDEIDFVATGLMNAFDQFRFRVTLENREFGAALFCLFLKPGLDVGQSRGAVMPGLAAAQ